MEYFCWNIFSYIIHKNIEDLSYMHAVLHIFILLHVAIQAACENLYNFSLWTNNFLGGRNDSSHRDVTCYFAIFFLNFAAIISGLK